MLSGYRNYRNRLQGPEIETLQDATNEAYTPPPKPVSGLLQSIEYCIYRTLGMSTVPSIIDAVEVEKKLKRRKSRSKRSQKLRAVRDTRRAPINFPLRISGASTRQGSREQTQTVSDDL